MTALPLYLLAAWLASLPRSRPGSCDSLTQEPGRSHVHTTQEASTMATPDTAVPTWQAELKRKHDMQIVVHQERFGLLGRPMSKKQSQALTRANKELEAEGYLTPLYKHGEKAGHIKVGKP